MAVTESQSERPLYPSQLANPLACTLQDRATSFSLPDTLLAGMPVASSLRRSPRCQCMETSLPFVQWYGSGMKFQF